jgi:phosphoribosyl 1,2-cyclic phosphodiesterase
MKVTLWGTRGSLASPGPETLRYGGNTPCVEVRGRDGTVLVLDAGTGMRRLGTTIGPETRRVDILLTHLHMDHIQGLGFFGPLYSPGLEVQVWGPASATRDLGARLALYLSPPLFPVSIRDLPCRWTLHNVPLGRFEIGSFEIESRLICHPGPTVGYRISENGASMAYLPDHEPALGTSPFPGNPAWTSGYDLAAGADLLIHDAQFTAEEYVDRVGWGHSALPDALAFARLAGVRRFVPFHHDPGHYDDMLDRMFEEAGRSSPPVEVLGGREGATFEVG